MIRVTAVRNAASRPNGNIAAKVGRNVVRLDGAEDTKLPFVHLCFTITPARQFAASSGEATVRWQDVVVARVDVSAFAPTHVRVPVRQFKAPSVLDIDLSFRMDERFYAEDFESYGVTCAELSDFSIVRAEDELGLRRLLIDAARGIAQELGLASDYLTAEKSARLRDVICRALAQGEGFSLVRLGDGEGRILGYPDHISDQEILSQVLYYHFGPESMGIMKSRRPDSWISDSVLLLRNLLVSAVRGADMVGLPVAEYYGQRGSEDVFGKLGYACATLYAASLRKDTPRTEQFGTNLFQLAASKGLLFKELAATADAMFIVTPWDLRETLGTALARDDIRHIKVPGHYTWRGSPGLGQYPELFRFVESAIRRQGDLAGHLFLVGAGIFGKHYCNLVKLQGGVALDIGSVFDSWARKGRPEAARSAHIGIERLQESSQIPTS